MKINLNLDTDAVLSDEVREQITLVLSCVEQGETEGVSFIPNSTISWKAE
jgi:hypothetical protein